MRTIRLFLPLFAVLAHLVLTAAPACAVVVAQWTFEAAPVTTLTNATGPSVPATTGLPSYLFFGKSGSASTITWQNAIGNGSANAYEGANTWPTNSYWQFNLSTTGYQSISFSFDVASKASGPRDFKVQTSPNGSVYTDLGFTYQVPVNGSPNPTWNSSTADSNYTIAITGLGTQFDNLPQLFVRLIQTSSTSASGGTVGSTGASRIDNVTVSGLVIAVPETSAALLLSAVASLSAARLLGRKIRHATPSFSARGAE